jgi:hypothetical protein
MIRRMDENGDGTINPDEVDDRRRQMLAMRFQMDFSQPVKVEEITRRFQGAGGNGQSNRQNSANPAERENGSTEAYRVDGSERLKGRKSYRNQPAELPKLMPDWWTKKDKDTNGQVTMAEFLSARADADVDEFDRFDLNRDGFITPHEAEKVQKDK